MKKTAGILPGIGYNADKPLLYYAAKIARSHGYEIIKIQYGDLPSNVFNDPNAMKTCITRAFEAARAQLRDIEIGDRVLLIGKSIGTAVANRIAVDFVCKTNSILFTPIEDTFEHPVHDAIIFHGTKDPWIDTDRVMTACELYELPLYVTPNANHSLETGDIGTDISELKRIMTIVQDRLDREDE